MGKSNSSLSNEISICSCNGCCKKKTGIDVCRTPICGQPEFLSIYAPVIYDEIGINLCRPITLPADVLAANPTVECVQLEVLDITFTPATTTVPGTTVTPLRTNCVSVLLTNVLVTFNVRLFDSNLTYLDTVVIEANYLPGNAASTDYAFLDPDTNPESVTVQLYAPYGVATTGTTPFINPIALIEESNIGVINGINATINAKGINFNTATGTFSAGISIVLRTVYYEAYKIEHAGKTVVPKASTSVDTTNACLEFVEGGLLSREIKPLELEPPKCEQKYKRARESACEVTSGMKQVCNKCSCVNGPCDGECCNVDDLCPYDDDDDDDIDEGSCGEVVFED